MGIVSPDQIESRFLELWNRSAGYVVFRVTAPDADPLVTPALPPGGDFDGEVLDLFGTLCPDELKLEIFAFSRANPERSALEDETLVLTPFASAVVELHSGLEYGCRADVRLITLAGRIYCDVLEVDESASAIGFVTNGSVQRQQGLQADDPPAPRQPEQFPLAGRVVNLDAQPIPNVEIRLLDLNESVFTDSEGRFEIQRPIGSYMLEAIVPEVEVTPGARRFAHRDQSDLPIEFLALTDIILPLSASEE
ncbi:MAG: carboxypeptidase-like regulatory domain-containing protein [Planctomycetota bacterium]